MKLYHGSVYNVEKPDLNYSNKKRDFGKGFYLTSDFEQAKLWSIKKGDIENKNPIVSIYELDDNYKNDLKIKEFDSVPNEEWFDFIVQNRTLDEDVKTDYDIIIGPVANDGTYEVINLYLRGILTIDVAIKELKTYKLKNQYVFKTNKSLSYLKYEGVDLL